MTLILVQCWHQYSQCDIPTPAWSKHERFLHQVHSVCQIGLLYFLFIQLYALNSLILFKMFIIGNEVWIYRRKNYYIYIYFLFKCWLLHKELCFFFWIFAIPSWLVQFCNFDCNDLQITPGYIYIYSPWTFLFDWRLVSFHWK